MINLNQINDLTIIGMDVVLPSGEGIDRFGWLMYRGLPISGQFGDKTMYENTIVQTVQHTLNEAGLSTQQVSINLLSPMLAKTLLIHGMDGRIHDFSSSPNPLMTALISAADRLNCGNDDATLLVETQLEPQVICVTILCTRSFAIDNSKHIYVAINSAFKADGPLTSNMVASTCESAIALAHIQPEWVGLIETASLTNLAINNNEMEGLLTTYLPNTELTCALGCNAGGLLGLIQTSWCLYQRVIPCVPNWTGPVNPNRWQQSPFYVVTDSRTWFLAAGQKKRYAALDLVSADDSFAHIIMSDEISTPLHLNGGFKNEMFYLFPIAAESVSHLVEKINTLQLQVSTNTNFTTEVQRIYKQFLSDKPASNCIVCLLAHTPDELNREINFAISGIPMASERNSDWQTPLGSYFTSKPLNGNGGVAFVYPGAFNSFPGVGQDLFYLFPSLYDRFSSFSLQISEMVYEKLLYPRSITSLSQSDLDKIETQLINDPLAMIISGTSLAVLYTLLLQEVFDIHPTSAFGYSLGEISMLFASGVWAKGEEANKALRSSLLFRTRLAGSQNAVRDFWHLPEEKETKPQDTLWGNYILMATPEKVSEVLNDEPHVYLTNINTPRQVVIAGDPDGCRCVIDSLKCNALQAPFNYVLHCEPMQSEYDELVKLNSWSATNQPNITLYSSATYQPMSIDQKAIAHQIASGLCNCLDFPRLIQQVHNDGARIFIELGAGSNCTRWIGETLKDQPHAAFAINRKGVDDYSSILRLLARIVCHRVPVNINQLY